MEWVGEKILSKNKITFEEDVSCPAQHICGFSCDDMSFKKTETWTSLVVQWLRIHLPIQGTWVKSLAQEVSTCCGATTLMHHNYWAHVLPGANVRSSARGKGHEEGGSAYTKAGLSLVSHRGNSRASTPKTRVCLLSALCSHLHLWLYGGLSPTTSLWKKS